MICFFFLFPFLLELQLKMQQDLLAIHSLNIKEIKKQNVTRIEALDHVIIIKKKSINYDNLLLAKDCKKTKWQMIERSLTLEFSCEKSKNEESLYFSILIPNYKMKLNEKKNRIDNRMFEKGPTLPNRLAIEFHSFSNENNSNSKRRKKSEYILPSGHPGSPPIRRGLLWKKMAIDHACQGQDYPWGMCIAPSVPVCVGQAIECR